MIKKLLVGLVIVGLLVKVLLFMGGCSNESSKEIILDSNPTTIPEESDSIVTSEEPVESFDIFLSLEEFQNQPHINVATSTKVEEKLKVVLGANPTLGYQWQENAGIDDESIVRQIEHRFIASITDTPGSPGQDVWTFEALKKGTTIISIECSRPWEDRNLETWELTITTTVK